MARTADMLKPSEAAVVAQVALRDVNRVIDEGILPEYLYAIDDGRHVLPAACFLIAFYVDTAKDLTAERRMDTIKELGSRLHEHNLPLLELLNMNWDVRDDVLKIDLLPFVRRTLDSMKRLVAARQMVETDPDILGGTPVIRGTRIPVHDVAASLLAGIPVKRILAAYPTLKPEMLELARTYAEANPLRGRPRATGNTPKEVVFLEDRKVPRRRKTE